MLAVSGWALFAQAGCIASYGLKSAFDPPDPTPNARGRMVESRIL
jgi:hypothetical protein